jgi:prevent-host-death family protein
MKELPLNNAKAVFSVLVDRAVAGGPSIITRHGHKEAILVSFEE